MVPKEKRKSAPVLGRLSVHRDGYAFVIPDEPIPGLRGDVYIAKESAQRGISEAELWDERARSYAAGRIVEPEEVASVIGFLVSEEASGVNGETVTVALGQVW